MSVSRVTTRCGYNRLQIDMSTAVHMTKDLREGTMFLLCIAHIWCLSKLPSPCSNFSCSCTPCVLYCLADCHKGLFLVNMQLQFWWQMQNTHKCFFAVQLYFISFFPEPLHLPTPLYPTQLGNGIASLQN